MKKSQIRKRPPATFPQHTLLVITPEMVSLPTFPNRARDSSDREEAISQVGHPPQSSYCVSVLFDCGTVMTLWHFRQLLTSFVENATFPLWHVPHAFPSL